MYCIVHGREHYPGETDSVDTVGDDLECREEEWAVVAGEVLGVPTVETIEDASFVVRGNMLGYLYTVTAGLVPVRVLSVQPNKYGENNATVRVTAGRPGYTRGEEFGVHVPNVTLVSRPQVYTRRGQIRVLGPTRFRTDEGTLL